MSIKIQNIAYLLIGTNMGNRISYLDVAISHLQKNFSVFNVSSIYETEAWGLEDQAPFLNQVVAIRTNVNEMKLLDKVLEIEQVMGRERHEKWGPRVIDIDVLYYNDAVVEEIRLIIPHPQIPNRRFVLVPLVELIPNYIHPQLKCSNLTLLNDCLDNLEVVKFQDAPILD